MIVLASQPDGKTHLVHDILTLVASGVAKSPSRTMQLMISGIGHDKTLDAWVPFNVTELETAVSTCGLHPTGTISKHLPFQYARRQKVEKQIDYENCELILR